MCLYPRLIINKKYTSTKKNGGIIPPVNDERTKYVPVGCQKCIECRKKKAREWQVRLLEDIRTNKNGKFITLTFNDKSIKELTEDVNNYIQEGNKRIKYKRYLTGYILDNEIAKRAMRLFNERYRKHHKKALRHWLVTEIGGHGTQNIHLHGIIWTDVKLEEVEKIWKYGYMWKGKKILDKTINYVNEATVGYITKYVNKTDEIHRTYNSIILTSSGIGGNYVNRRDVINNMYNGEKTNETYRTRTGHKITLPIYWRNKIYTEEEREKLWIQKLNKEERWVMGHKISIKEGYEEYNKAVEYQRKNNIKLGYGTDEKDEDRQEYEREVRIIMQKTRIAKGKIQGGLCPAAPSRT